MENSQEKASREQILEAALREIMSLNGAAVVLGPRIAYETLMHQEVIKKGNKDE